ncbi:hypothetical protein [Saccharopolyspora taberi]|uniref:Uncharacterized protein n=1 Tax=Saccharopolyspora taberi TaxID=60895 RepID=A0ABN3V9B1_9PSEU
MPWTKVTTPRVPLLRQLITEPIGPRRAPAGYDPLLHTGPRTPPELLRRR